MGRPGIRRQCSATAAGQADASVIEDGDHRVEFPDRQHAVWRRPESTSMQRSEMINDLSGRAAQLGPALINTAEPCGLTRRRLRTVTKHHNATPTRRGGIAFGRHPSGAAANPGNGNVSGVPNHTSPHAVERRCAPFLGLMAPDNCSPVIGRTCVFETCRRSEFNPKYTRPLAWRAAAA